MNKKHEDHHIVEFSNGMKFEIRPPNTSSVLWVQSKYGDYDKKMRAVMENFLKEYEFLMYFSWQLIDKDSKKKFDNKFDKFKAMMDEDMDNHYAFFDVLAQMFFNKTLAEIEELGKQSLNEDAGAVETEKKPQVKQKKFPGTKKKTS